MFKLSFKFMANDLFKRTALPRSYDKTIDALIEKFDLDSPDETLLQARRAYFETAMSKGAVLSSCPSGMKEWSAVQLEKAAADLPDKEAQGWSGITALSMEDRLDFAKAAEKRSAKLWVGLFPQGQKNIVLPFEGQSARSNADKIEHFIYDHNKKAESLLKKALKEDAKLRKKNPEAPSTVGRAIEQRQIRFDPDDGTKLQTLDPVKQKWMPGPRFAKFLQDEYEWMLYELVQRGNDLNTTAPVAGTDDTSFLTLLDHKRLDNTDSLFLSGKLRVVISSDAQKIGEMSTGQRWYSCMARDGCNFRYVKNDIEQGSLVAYVVHEDDPEACYPLMRQLLKPFRNKGSDTIFVPARIYGGDGSSLTRDALQLTVSSFIANYNTHRKGNFRMAQELYEDGQAVWINLQDSWHNHTISQALQDYQSGALKEWLTELDNNVRYIENDRKGRYGENPADTERKLKNKILRLFRCKDAETGLPRMFYREQLRTHVGSSAHPRAIHQVSQDDPVLNMREAALQALKQGDVKKWMENKGSWSEDLQQQLPYLAVITAKPEDGIHTSLPMHKILVDQLTPKCDWYGSLGYSRESKTLFFYTMEKAIASLDRLSSEDLLFFTQAATDFLYETTDACRKSICINSNSWMDGSQEVSYNFEKKPEEEEVAAYWCPLMQRLQKENPAAAAGFAKKIHEQYKNELSYTAQHKLAAEILTPTELKRAVPVPQSLRNL